MDNLYFPLVVFFFQIRKFLSCHTKCEEVGIFFFILARVENFLLQLKNNSKIIQSQKFFKKICIEKQSKSPKFFFNFLAFANCHHYQPTQFE